MVHFLNMTAKTIDVYFNSTKVSTVKPYGHTYTTARPGTFMIYGALGKKFFEKVPLVIDPKKDGENASYYYNVLGLGSFAIFDITGIYKSKNSLLGAVLDSLKSEFKFVSRHIKEKLFVFKDFGLIIAPQDPLPKTRSAFVNVYQILPISPKWEGEKMITEEAYKLFVKKLKTLSK